MSIYATIGQVKVPITDWARDEGEWVEVYFQGVPCHSPAVGGDELDLVRHPIGVAVDHRTDVTGLQAVLSGIPFEDDTIELANHHHPPRGSG